MGAGVVSDMDDARAQCKLSPNPKSIMSSSVVVRSVMLSESTGSGYLHRYLSVSVDECTTTEDDMMGMD